MIHFEFCQIIPEVFEFLLASLELFFFLAEVDFFLLSFLLAEKQFRGDPFQVLPVAALLSVPLAQLIGNPLRQPFELIQFVAELEDGPIKVVDLFLAVCLFFHQGLQRSFPVLFLCNDLFKFPLKNPHLFLLLGYRLFQRLDLPFPRKNPVGTLNRDTPTDNAVEVDHVPFRGHQAVVLAVARPRGNRLIQVFHEGCASKQGIDDRLVLLRNFDQVLHQRESVGFGGRGLSVEFMEGNKTASPFGPCLEVLDGVLSVLLAFHDDVLEFVAENRLQGMLESRLNLDDVGHQSLDSPLPPGFQVFRLHHGSNPHLEALEVLGEGPETGEPGLVHVEGSLERLELGLQVLAHLIEFLAHLLLSCRVVRNLRELPSQGLPHLVFSFRALGEAFHFFAHLIPFSLEP